MRPQRYPGFSRRWPPSRMRASLPPPRRLPASPPTRSGRRSRVTAPSRKSVMREQIARLQELRARETVAYDVATAYLQALEAAAFRRIAVDTIRRAEAVLEDVRARRAGGVALRDDVLRGEVQLSESREALGRAEDAEITALARLNNALGRDASLPLRLAEGLSAGPFAATLAECLQRAATQRPEVGV